MVIARCLLPLAAAACLIATPAPAQAPPPAARSELRVLGASLDGAVRRVSRASYLASQSATRSYLLPGVGVVFVLPPQSLPLVRSKRAESPALRALADATRRIEETLKSVSSPGERARLEQSLRSLRETRAEMSSSGFAFHMSTGPEGQLTVETTTLGSDPAAMAEAQRLLDTADRDLGSAMEREFRELQEQAEAFRVRAEEARQEAELSLRRSLQRTDGTAPPAPPVPPQTPAAALPEAPDLPPAPPWQAFFDFGEPEDTRTPDAVIQEVRQAVVRTLAAQAGRLTSVRPEEQVVVAVDFLPWRRTGLRAMPERTLVIRVPKKHLDEVKAGRLSAEEFGRRVQAFEY